MRKRESQFEFKLKSIIPIVLGEMNDERINSLSINEVKCFKNRYNAKVYLDPSIFSEIEKKDILKQLTIASRYIQSLILNHESWFRVPTLIFEFDTHLDELNKLDKLFKQISTERKQ